MHETCDAHMQTSFDADAQSISQVSNDAVYRFLGDGLPLLILFPSLASCRRDGPIIAERDAFLATPAAVRLISRAMGQHGRGTVSHGCGAMTGQPDWWSVAELLPK
jgi:hypothetical protein